MQTTPNPALRMYMNKLKLAKGSSGIHIKPSHKGLFTAKAKGAGMGVQQYASHVLSKGSGASAATRKQANFARNAKKWNR
jgi:hypothetical protein